MIEKTQLNEITHPAGFLIREEAWTVVGDSSTRMVSTYNMNGDYIGDLETAVFLVLEKGILPELASPNNTICSIGKSKFDNRWYGWSHRAMGNFGIGSEITPESIGYAPVDEEDFMNHMIKFWDDEYHLNVRGSVVVENHDGEELRGVKIEWEYADDVPNVDLHGMTQGYFTPFPEKYGRGAWVAETDEDARQMAIDYANEIG